MVADIAHRIDIWYQYVPYFDKDMTKFPQELHHVFDEIAHSCPASCCIWKLGSYVIGSIDSLASTERAFGFVPISDGLGHLCEDIRTRRVLRGATQRLAVGAFTLVSFVKQCKKTSDYDKIQKTDACVTFGQGILQGNETSRVCQLKAEGVR